jgi:5-methyltetrahydrofolate--homocysteine methyltransferase
VRFNDSPPPWWLVAVTEAQSRRTNMLTLAELSQAIEKGNRNEAKRLTQELLNAGATPLDIVEKGLVPGMAIVGEKFKNNQIFVPEILLAARAMKEAMALLEPLLARAGIKPKYTAVIGTVQGDLHDIGKNLVAMMWKGANFGVVDLGTNVPPEKFVAAAREHNAQIIGLSALLTTTMLAMKTTVRAIRGAGLNSVKIIVGGAPITQEFAREIGADGYGSDAATAVEVARQLVAA